MFKFNFKRASLACYLILELCSMTLGSPLDPLSAASSSAASPTVAASTSASTSSVSRVGQEFLAMTPHNENAPGGESDALLQSGYQVNVSKVFVILGGGIFFLVALLAFHMLSFGDTRSNSVGSGIVTSGEQEGWDSGDSGNFVLKSDLDRRSLKYAAATERILTAIEKLYRAFDDHSKDI